MQWCGILTLEKARAAIILSFRVHEKIKRAPLMVIQREQVTELHRAEPCRRRLLLIDGEEEEYRRCACDRFAQRSGGLACLHASDLDYAKLVFTDEDAALFAKYVKSTRVRAARNISGFSLPAGSSKEDRLAVEEVLKTAFSNLPDNLKGTYYPLGELTSEQEDELQAGGFLFQKPGPMQLLGDAGAGRNWPEGRGIFHNPDKTVLCWCNEEDQCRIIAMENGVLSRAYSRASASSRMQSRWRLRALAGR
jgi:hypothetical protein